MKAPRRNHPGVLALNHHALDLLRSRSYGEAVAAIKCALTQVRHGLVSQPPASTKFVSPFETEMDVDEHDEEDPSTYLDVLMTCPLSSFDDACHPGAASDFHLIDSGLLLSGLEADLLASTTSQARATAVLCYNLAMVYHLTALHGQNPRGNFQRALSLYNLVATSTMLGSADEATSHGGADTLIRMLVWNNKGHVHSCLQELDQVKACADLLAEMVDDGEPWVLGTPMMLIQLNVLLHSGKRNPAPAA